MKKIDQTLSTLPKQLEDSGNQQTRSEIGSGVKPEVEAAMTIVWNEMAGRKGQRWWMQNFDVAGSETFNSWCKCVNDLSPTQIERGLEKSMNDTSYPTAEKFRQHCIENVVNEEMYKTYKPYKRLTSDEQIKKRNELGRKWINKIKSEMS